MGSVFENKFCVQAEGSDCCGSCSRGVQRGKQGYACMHGAPWNENEYKRPSPLVLPGTEKESGRRRRESKRWLVIEGKRGEWQRHGKRNEEKGKRVALLTKVVVFKYKFTLVYIESKFFFFVTFCNRILFLTLKTNIITLSPFLVSFY